MSVMHHLARVVIGHDNGTEHELRDLIVDAYSVQRQRVVELEANIQSMGRATNGLRKSSEVMANELTRALTRVAELERMLTKSLQAERDQIGKHGSTKCDLDDARARVGELEGERDELKTQLRIEVAELNNEEGMRAQCEDEALSASLRAKVAESRVVELEGELDRASYNPRETWKDLHRLRRRVLSAANSMGLGHKTMVKQGAETATTEMVVECERLRVAIRTKFAVLGELVICNEHPSHTPKPAEPRPVGDVCQECLGSGWPLMKGERPTQEPRPMSEAPLGSDWLVVIQAVCPEGMAALKDDYDVVGWVPTTSGEEKTNG